MPCDISHRICALHEGTSAVTANTEHANEQPLQHKLENSYLGGSKSSVSLSPLQLEKIPFFSEGDEEECLTVRDKDGFNSCRPSIYKSYSMTSSALPPTATPMPITTNCAPRVRAPRRLRNSFFGRTRAHSMAQQFSTPNSENNDASSEPSLKMRQRSQSETESHTSSRRTIARSGRSKLSALPRRSQSANDSAPGCPKVHTREKERGVLLRRSLHPMLGLSFFKSKKIDDAVEEVKCKEEDEHLTKLLEATNTSVEDYLKGRLGSPHLQYTVVVKIVLYLSKALLICFSFPAVVPEVFEALLLLFENSVTKTCRYLRARGWDTMWVLGLAHLENLEVLDLVASM